MPRTPHEEALPLLRAADIDLIRFGQDRFELIVGSKAFLLTQDGFAKLCRVGNAYKHLVDPKVDSGPPYVVHVRIPYLDCDAEQTTPASTHPVALADRADVEPMCVAVRAELEAMSLSFDDYDWTVVPSSVPEDYFLVEDLEPADFATALSRFRRSVAVDSAHGPDMVAEWYEAFGITEEEWEDRDSLEADRFRLNGALRWYEVRYTITLLDGATAEDAEIDPDDLADASDPYVTRLLAVDEADAAERAKDRLAEDVPIGMPEHVEVDVISAVPE